MVGGLASSVVWPGAVQCEFGDVWHCQFCGRKVLLADIYIYMTGFGVSSFAAWCIVTLGDLAMVSCEVGGVWHHQFCDQVTVLLYCVFWGGLAFPVWFGLVYGDCGFGMFWH